MLLDDSVVNMLVVGVGEGMVPGKYDKLNSDRNIGAAFFSRHWVSPRMAGCKMKGGNSTQYSR